MIGIISLVVKATVVMACAFAAAAIARRARASMRHAVFAALFITLLLLPVAPWLMPTAKTIAVVPLSSPGVILSAAEREGSPTSSVPVPVPGDSSPASRLGMTQVAGMIYGGGLVAFLTFLAAGVWRLRRWADDGEIWLEGTTIAAAVAHENSIRRAVLVVISDDVAVPLTFGFRRQTIVMPAAARNWTTDAVRRAIRHELEHVRRDDWAMQLVARVACALYWPHPMVWAALRRFCLEAERACDDAVITVYEAPTYADQLVVLARTLDRRPRVPALAMASPSRLSERVRAILDPKQPRGPQSRTMLLLTAAVMVAVVVTFGSVQLAAAAADLPEPVSNIFEDEDEADTYREAIVRAAEKGDIKALDFFERGGIDLNKPISGDGTPLLIAARRGRIEAVRWLLDRGVDPNVPSPGDGNALIAAAGAGQTDIMVILLDRGARIEDVVPGDENALITAAAEGSDQAVKLLIRRGANVNARVWADDREWRTPLNMARRNGHQDIVRILLQAGAQR
ncbi:MAG TPA: M56 family metallopeptidase [Thermoanaerobaculia bacterium]|nr:M56 family metallopeptidase [Thermoanaerobaculia bacterium]